MSGKCIIHRKNPGKLFTLLFNILISGLVCEIPVASAPVYTPPPSPRQTFNFNLDWKFIKTDVPEAIDPDYDDSSWETVSLPHTYNDVDSFDELITRSGERTLYMGPATYRKKILPASRIQKQESIFRVRGHAPSSRFLFERQTCR